MRAARTLLVSATLASFGACAARSCPPTAPAAAGAPVAPTACHRPTGPVTVTFAAQVTLPALVAWASATTCRTYVYAPELASRATQVVSAGPIAPDAIDALLIQSLAAMNLRIDGDGDVVRLVATDPPPLAPSDPAASSALDDELAAAIAAGVQRVDDTHVVISRALVDRVLANPMAMARGARVVPSIKNGQPNGFKLYAIRPGSFYAAIGLANGDTIHAINGLAVTSTDAALDVYAKVKDATRFEFEITRRGRDLTLTYTIK